MGRLTDPHQILSWLDDSSTMNLSSGERPVCLPVRTTSGPSAAIRPSPSRMAASYRAAVERFDWTDRPSGPGDAFDGGAAVREDWVMSGTLQRAGDLGRSDRPRVPRRPLGHVRSRLPQSLLPDRVPRPGRGGSGSFVGRVAAGWRYPRGRREE